MSATLLGSYLVTSVDATNTLIVTITSSIPAGSVIIVGLNRGASSASTCGINTLTTSAGAFGPLRRIADACRASTHDLSILAVEVTTTIPSGSNLTATYYTPNAGKRGAVFSIWSNVTLPPIPDGTSGTFVDGVVTGTTSYGSNGSSTGPNTATAAVVAAGSHLEIFATSIGSTSTFTPAVGWTLIGDAHTTSGTSDRGVILFYRNETTPGGATVTASGTLSASGGWATAIGTFAAAAGNTSPTVSLSASSASGQYGDQIVLTATASDPDGSIVSYTFSQTAGPSAGISGSGNTRTITLPSVLPSAGNQVLTFQVLVTDNGGATATATVNVTATPWGFWWADESASWNLKARSFTS